MIPLPTAKHTVVDGQATLDGPLGGPVATPAGRCAGDQVDPASVVVTMRGVLVSDTATQIDADAQEILVGSSG
jgi:hypothetical protein